MADKFSKNDHMLDIKNEADIRDELHLRLHNSGEREKLANELRKRLYECGWREQVTKYCFEITNQYGPDNLTVESLVEHVTPMARRAIPNEIKRDMLAMIETKIEKLLKER